MQPETSHRWDSVRQALLRLPDGWRAPFEELIERSRAASLLSCGVIWTPSRTMNVIAALDRWSRYCTCANVPLQPTGSTLEAYAEALKEKGSVSTNSIAYYLERIVTGYHQIIAGTKPGPGAVFVARRYRYMRTAPTTKSASQLVGATAIFDLGVALFNAARTTRKLDSRTAIMARDGIFLMLAASFPERASALAHLQFETSLKLGPRPEIVIDLPGEVLKGNQNRKSTSRRRELLRNVALWDALQEYQLTFHDRLTQGLAVFPSQLGSGEPLTAKRLSQIMGQRTSHRFGVRISLHRVRDNVATEAVENLKNGPMVASGVLGHRDPKTTAKHYDRSAGRAAMREIAARISARKGKPTRLKV